MEHRGSPRSLSMPTGYTSIHQVQTNTRYSGITPPKNHYRIIHGLTTLTDALIDAPNNQSYAKRQAISDLHDASNSWDTPNDTPEPFTPTLKPTPAQTRRGMKILERKLKHPAITD